MMDDPTDAVLIQRSRQGDRRCFEAILKRYERQLYAAAYRIMQNSEDAVDVTQTAFMRAYEHLDRYDPKLPFRSWLYRIAVNEALDQVRARRPAEMLAEEMLDDREGPDEAAIRQQSDGVMQSALMALKLDHRKVIVLKHLQGCSYEEMAQILDCPVKTVKSRLFTARQALREVLLAQGRL